MNEDDMRAKLATSLEYVAKIIRENSGRPIDWSMALSNINFYVRKMDADRAMFEMNHAFSLVAMGAKRN